MLIEDSKHLTYYVCIVSCQFYKARVANVLLKCYNYNTLFKYVSEKRLGCSAIACFFDSYVGVPASPVF